MEYMILSFAILYLLWSNHSLRSECGAYNGCVHLHTQYTKDEICHMYVINGCFIVPWKVWGSNFAMGLNTSVLGYINNTVSYIPLAVAVLFWLYPIFTDKGTKKKRMRPWDRPARTFILCMLAICAIDAMIIELCNTRKHLQKNKLKCKSCPLWKCLILKVQKLHYWSFLETKRK